MPKVLVSGVAGFLGTHVAEYFKKQGWMVYGFDNLTDYELKREFNVRKSRRHNLGFLDYLGIYHWKEDCRAITGDMLIIDGPFDLIIHCAAQPAMTIALEDPKYDADNNILSCINMLEIARKLNVPFVNCSSIHVYGNDLNEGLGETETRFVNVPEEINENQPVLKGELTPLHISKYATELYTQSYAEMYGMKTASFRLTGMYGERQFGGMDHGWVANFAIRTIMEKPITIFGTDKQVRDILYAGDAARAFECWFKAGCPTGIYNIGGGIENSISLGECLWKLKLINNNKQPLITINPKRKGDLWYFVCDYQKAKREFNWKPEISIDKGLIKLYDWITSNRELFCSA